ncbi:hypothetical protein E5D57_006162 [Metarhizium anisopliae]|nr:hypothetical protein E5D57_006162 [Metarhizium anisopliae]
MYLTNLFALAFAALGVVAQYDDVQYDDALYDSAKYTTGTGAYVYGYPNYPTAEYQVREWDRCESLPRIMDTDCHQGAKAYYPGPHTVQIPAAKARSVQCTKHIP